MPTVLLLEDDEALNRMICKTLMLAGYEVECETNPVSALDKVAKQPSLMVLDLNLPELDGPTFLAEAIERGFRGKVIVTSGAEDAKAVSEWMAADAFLPKPVDPDELVDTVKRVTLRPF